MAAQKSGVDRAIAAALRAYRQSDPVSDKAFRDFEQARKTAGVLDEFPESIRKAHLIAEARALDHIGDVAKDRARQNRRDL